MAFEVAENWNVNELAAFMSTPSIYWATADALAPQPEEIDWTRHLLQANNCTFACKFQGVVVGFVSFLRRTSIGAEIHVGFHEKFRGKIAKACIMHAIGLAFRDKGLFKLWAMIPSDNVAAIRLARMIGFQHEGRITQAVVRQAKDGPPVRDIVILGLSKE